LLLKFELVTLTTAAEKLALDFKAANLVPANKFEDALHLAIAVERGFEFIVSWNFSHMVNAKTQKRLPVISAQHGYFHQTLIYCPSSF
jgi:hypothetical protein